MTQESEKPLESTFAPDQMGIKPSRSVTIALGYLVSCIDHDHGCKNGQTALYWHLRFVCAKHLKNEAVDNSENVELSKLIHDAILMNKNNSAQKATDAVMTIVRNYESFKDT